MRIIERQELIVQELERADADAWVVADFRGSNPAFARLLGQEALKSTRRAFLVARRDRGPELLIHHVDAGNFRRLGLPVHPYRSRDEQIARLRDLLAGCRLVLMEYSPLGAIPYVGRVDAGTIELVRSLGVEVGSSADLLAAVVAHWSERDLRLHRQAAAALDAARDALFAALGAALRRGATWTELDAQRFLLERFAAAGLESDHPPIVAVNAHAGDPHYAPTAEHALPIAPGDLVLVDLWARVAQPGDGQPGAYADITWMAVAAERPTAQQEQVWQIVRAARDAAVEFLRQRWSAGAPVAGYEVDRVARALIERAGYGAAFTHRTGHSLGWDSAHGEGVNIDGFETHDTRQLRPGAAFSIEPGIYLPEFGVRSEINVAITASGVEVTTPPQQEIVRLLG